MAQINVKINGRTYQVACEDGQEEHVTKLAGYIDNKVGDLVKQVGQVGEARLLVMSSLLIADEMAELYEELQEIRGEGDAVADIPDVAPQREAVNGAHLENLARRIDAVSERLLAK
jgi:cell division protein ZapA